MVRVVLYNLFDLFFLLVFQSPLCRIVDYKFDTENELWCEISLAFDVAKKTLDMSNVIKKAAAAAVVKVSSFCSLLLLRCKMYHL